MCMCISIGQHSWHRGIFAPVFNQALPVQAESSPQTLNLSAGVVVVGGGPSGYTAAMALSKQGFQDILILERSATAGAFNPTVGFVFNISGPGRAALSEIGVAHLQDIGVFLPRCDLIY